MGQSKFLSESEGQVLVTTDENIDSRSLQSILSSFGDLRVFTQMNASSQQVRSPPSSLLRND